MGDTTVDVSEENYFTIIDGKSSEPNNEDSVLVEERVSDSPTENSVICLDENDESEDYKLPELPAEIVSFLGAAPENVSNNNDDEDLKIVYEKFSQPSEVQIVINVNSQFKNQNKKNQRKNNKEPLQSASANNNDEAYSTSKENRNPPSPAAVSLEDSVCIVGEFDPPTFPSVISQSNRASSVLPAIPNLTYFRQNPNYRFVKDPLLDSAEKKKRKIECTVCYDGPEEISLRGIDVVSTVCGHIFCSECIKTAIKNSKQCPQCRKRLNNKQFHPIYL